MGRMMNRASGGAALALVFAVLGGGAVGCGGEILPEPPGSTGGNLSGGSGGGGDQGSSPGGGASSGAGVSSGSSSGSSTGVSSGSSPGVPGQAGGSSSGQGVSPPILIGSSGVASSSGSSSGAYPGSGPCADLGVPDIAEVCPDGTYAAGEYIDEGGQCVLSFNCPTSTSPASPPGTPPATGCTGALPDICEVCSSGKTACAHFVVVDAECVTEICPKGAGGVSPGGPVMVSPPGEPVDGGELDASEPPPAIDAGPTGCSQGAACEYGSGCGSAGGACDVSCTCTEKGFLECSESCEEASAPVGTGTASPPPM